MLLILARLSTEMRYVTAATKVFPTEIRLSGGPREPFIVLLQWGLCVVPRLPRVVDAVYMTTCQHRKVLIS